MMKPLATAGRSALNLSYASALIALVVVGGLAALNENQSREAFRRSSRAEAAEKLDLLRADVQARIDADIQVARGLAGVVAFRPDLGQDEFARLGAGLIGGAREVLHIAALPDLVISRLYPLEGSEAALGFDMRTAPEQEALALLARDTGTAIFDGPFDLAYGGEAFLVHAPVFVEGPEAGAQRFWGVVAAVIDPAAFFAASGLTRDDLPVEVALIGRDGPAVAGSVIFGEPALVWREPVAAMVDLPVGTWQMIAVPRGGWPDMPGVWRMRAFFALAALLIVVPILGVARLAASRQRKLATIQEREAELARLSWRLDFALSASKIGVWDVDLKTGSLLWDDRARELMGAGDRQGPFGPDDWTRAIHPEDRARADAAADAALAGDGHFAQDYRVVRPDGSVRHIRDTAARHRGADGSDRLVGLVWDMTADVERQQELDERRAEAEAATAAKSQFLAAMSHEIRTPMSGVLGMLDLMLGEPLSARQRERARVAQSSAHGLLAILNDILDFSKLEASQVRLNAEDVEPRAIVREVVKLMAPGAERKGLELTAEVVEAVPDWVVTDPARLRQVLSNLVSNALKFTETGSIRVRMDYDPETAGGSLRVEVEDTGIGIPEELHGQVFEQFVQADNTLTRRTGGTGLGLAICRQLVGLMGGRISVESRPDGGSTFGFSIAARPGAAPSAAPAVAESAAEAPTPPMRVLVAEDNATNQYVINAYLKAAGHTVTMVENGAQAVEAAAGGGFDVVLMDVQMPQMDGPTAAQTIRALEGPARDLYIVALTANAIAGDRERFLAAGMSDYVSKPIELRALAAALARAHRAGKAAAGGDVPLRRALAG